MLEKDISINFPREKIYEIPIKTIVSKLQKEIGSKTTDSSTRLHDFLKAYEEEFKEDLINKRLSFDITESEVLRMMKAPLTFYALNMNGRLID